MWLLLLATLTLTFSGFQSGRQFMYGLHREDGRRQLDALLIHLCLSVLFALYSFILGVDTLPTTMLLIGGLTLTLGLLLIKRDPPHELSQSFVPTSSILEN